MNDRRLKCLLPVTHHGSVPLTFAPMKFPIPSLDQLTTMRLVFHTPVISDAAWWMEYINDPRAIRFMPFALGSNSDCAAFIQRSLDRIHADGSGLHAVIERATQRPVGMIGLLTQVVDDIDELEIGYHLVPSEWGKGYATEAAIACREFARKHLCASSVISLIDHENLASQAVAQRNGMTFEKHTVHRGIPAMVWRYRFD
jgi:ribosomal-protein-alanine N-acetyltransferase